MTIFKLPEGVPKKAKPKKLHERESVIEEYLRDTVKARGEIAYKFTSPQRRSVPDRLVLGSSGNAAKVLDKILHDLDVPTRLGPMTLRVLAEEIVAEMIYFVEVKATGQKPTELQEREHTKLRARGFRVEVLDSKAEVDARYPK